MHAHTGVRGSFVILALAFLTSCSSSLPGTDAQMRDIERFVGRTLETLPEIPSIGLSIVHDGKTYARGYGYADLATKRPSDADTIYYNGSNTKAYTALFLNANFTPINIVPGRGAERPPWGRRTFGGGGACRSWR